MICLAVERRTAIMGERAYDETALLQLGEVVRVLAERGATDPKAAINTILSL